MTSITRLVKFEFALIHMLFFRMIFERITNTLMAAIGGFGAVYYSAFTSRGIYVITPNSENYARVQGMILFSFLYAETIMANWQYTTNKTGRMELIFNSTQPPLLIIFIKCLASACITLASLVLLYLPFLIWFNLTGTYNSTLWFAAGATLLVCWCIMSFNAVFEFQLKQVKALTSMINLVLPYMAMRLADHLPRNYDFIPYFNVVRFINMAGAYNFTNVVWLYFTSTIAGLLFLLLAQLVVRRIRSTASVYLD